MKKMESLVYTYHFALRKFDFRLQWSATHKNRGWSKKTWEWTVMTSGGGSLADGSSLQRGSAPPPPPGGCLLSWVSALGLVVPRGGPPRPTGWAVTCTQTPFVHTTRGHGPPARGARALGECGLLDPASHHLYP